MSNIFIINAYPGAGKSLFARYCKEIIQEKYPICFIHTISVIDPIKEIAAQLGWSGEKDEKGRLFLATLKDMADTNYNFTQNYCKKIFSLLSARDFIFIDMRSSYDIDWAVKNYKAHSIFIKRDGLENKDYGNHADREVENYNYQYYIENCGSKEELRAAANLFLYKNILY